jgi:hypothetical protein
LQGAGTGRARLGTNRTRTRLLARNPGRRFTRRSPLPSVYRVDRMGVKTAVSAGLASLALLAVASPAHALLGIGLSATTQPPGKVTSSSAVLTGQISPLSLSTSYYFEIGPTTSYGTQTPVTYVTSLLSAQPVQAGVTGLKPGTTYHYRIVAGELLSTVRGADMTFKTAATGSSSGGGSSSGTGSSGGTGGPGDTPTATTPTGSGNSATGQFPDDFVPTLGISPVLGTSVAAAPATGDVRVRVAGSAMFVPLEGEASLPVGTVVDTRQGTVNLVSALDHGDATQAAQFQGAVFQVRQTDQNSGMTDLYLRGGDFRPCWPPTASGVVASRSRARTVRRLWGRDRGGRFRTHGSRAVATVRGTTWSVADRCDGTVTKVAEGSVSVYDRGTRRNVLVNAGHSYLARAHR